jgi:hypothetical protein
LIRSFHIDCSKWESRRSLQRAVAEQLELPDEVMKMFGSQDEVDDFRGVAHGYRCPNGPGTTGDTTHDTKKHDTNTGTTRRT